MDSKLLKRLAFLSFVLVPFPACSDDGEQSTTNGETTDGGDDDDDDDDDDSDPTDASQTVTDTDPTATVTDTDPTVTVTDTDPTVTDTDPDSSSTDPTDATESSSSTDPTDATESSSSTDPTDATESSTTDPSASTTDTGEPGDGWGDCLEDTSVCTAEETCIYAPLPGDPANGSVCSGQGCASEDDCPVQPGGGDAPTVCADLTGDKVNDCVISCAGGETCPDGMICAFDIACVWPTEWTCDPFFYGVDDGCDCGCGIPDPDCVDASVDSCDYCNDTGSCSEDADMCPGTIDPENNAVCQ